MGISSYHLLALIELFMIFIVFIVNSWETQLERDLVCKRISFSIMHHIQDMIGAINGQSQSHNMQIDSNNN